MDKKVAILLVLFNEKKHIERLARSIIDQSYKEVLVYAYDNNSSDSSSEQLSKYLPNVKLIHSDENVGFAKGNNIIASEAIKNNEDLLFILNTDMELEHNCVKNLVDIFNENSEVIGAGPIIFIGTDAGKTKNIQCYADQSNFSNGQTRTLYHGENINFEALPDKLYVNSLHGGCFMIRSSVVKELGLFNEDNFMYNDEIDLAYRLSRVNGKLITAKNAQAWHFHDWNKKNKSGYYLQYYYINRNRFLFFYRYNKYISFIREILIELFLFPLKIKWAKKTSDLRLLKYYYLGYWHGLLNKKGKATVEFE